MKAAASTPGSSLFPLLPAKTEPEGFEPDPETVDPFLSEEEVCGDGLQAVEATCVHEQTEAWCLAPEDAAANSAAAVQSRERGEIFGLRDSWQVVSGLGSGAAGLQGVDLAKICNWRSWFFNT